MEPQQPGDRALAGRRADAGSVRLGARDVTGLVLCAEHYGAPYDLLAAALDVRPDRLRGIVARWRHAGYAATGTLGPGPAWCWLTPAGMTVTGLTFPATRPALARLVHIRAAALVPARIRHGRPARLLVRAVVAAVLSLLVLHAIPGQASGPAVVTGLITLFVLSARGELAPPPGR